MIWFALRVQAQREFVAERILREEGLTTFVPVKHVVKRNTLRRRTIYAGRRQLLAFPQMPGFVFIAVGFHDTVPWDRIRKFENIVLGVMSNHGGWAKIGEGIARRFDETEIIRVFGKSQRPYLINAQILRKTNDDRKKRRRLQPNAEIISGPYQGKLVKHTVPVTKKDEETSRDVDELYELCTNPIAKTG